MPLPILLGLVVGGIAGLVLLIHLLGYSKPLTLRSESAARRHWARHFPDDAVTDVTICASGSTALVETDHGPGLLWSFGTDTVARRLHSAEARITDTGVTIRLPDFSAPRVDVRMGENEAQYWVARIAKEAA
ncbi:MAG: hypothetical protein QNJ44_06640 [Rhodobacter sp.]|nr:hypothetical protein [Rhodobacter sp.]